MREWNECIEIYKDGDFVDDIDVDQDLFYLWQQYCTAIRREPQHSVWYDTITKFCFGPEIDFYSNPQEFSFFAQAESFWENPQWGLNHVQNYLAESLGTDARRTTEYVIQNLPALDKFAGKHILVVGAGPSTNAVDWENIDSDFIWSCNGFYKHPALSRMEIDLAVLGPGHSLKDPAVIKYFEENDTICAIEGGTSPFKTQEELKEFKEKFPERTCYYHLRYFSKLGTIPRLICLATFLGASKVSVVGMDGHPINHQHSFEGGDKQHVGCALTPGARDRYRREFVLFWDYLLNHVTHNTKYENLGEGHPANQTTDISLKKFPLSKSTKNKLGV